MDRDRFDLLTRSVSMLLSRRALAVGLGLSAFGWSPVGAARKRRRCKQPNRKFRFNDFGCLNVGATCAHARQCCSGICQRHGRGCGLGKCQAHDTGGCQAGEDSCLGDLEDCITTTGATTGVCLTTTGKAGYCMAGGGCFPCRKDVDCQAVCGPHAACIVCASDCAASGGTACAGPSEDSCDFPES